MCYLFPTLNLQPALYSHFFSSFKYVLISLTPHLHLLRPPLPWYLLQRAVPIYTFLIFSQVFYFSNPSIWFLPVRLPQNYSCRFNQRGLYYQILWLFLKRCWCLSPFSTLFPGFLPTFLATPSQVSFVTILFSGWNVGNRWGSFLGRLLSSHHISTLNVPSVSLSSKTMC